MQKFRRVHSDLARQFVSGAQEELSDTENLVSAAKLHRVSSLAQREVTYLTPI